MKQGLIIEKGKNSYAFASREEIEGVNTGEAEVWQVGDNLKVDVEKMKQHAKDIGSALQGFNNFGETPFEETSFEETPFEDELELLAGMNADFTAQYERC